MKKTLIKEISRLKSLMSILNENTDNKIAVLIDGTSSAGKSMTAKLLNAVPFYESKDPNQWVVIDSDHFSDDAKDGKGEERRLNFDHPNIRDWARDNDSGIVSGLYRKTDESVPENPYEDEYIEGTDARNWYMAQEYKKGPWKRVIFDDIGNGILKYIPNVKNILLHAPIHVLLQNIKDRNVTGKEPRKYENVLDHYLKKYEATKSVPDVKFGHSDSVTKNGLKQALLDSNISEEYVNRFLNDLGVTSDGEYFIKIKDSYITPDVQLINVDPKRTEYLNDFKGIIDVML